MSGTVRVAIVGAGYMAREHARAFHGLPGAALCGIFSRTAARATALAREFGVPEVCASVDQLFGRTRADLVVVTVRELSMNEIAVRCFAHPWTVLLEKPAGYDLADAEDILGSAKGSGALKRTFVALNRRSYQSTLQAMALLPDSGPRFIKVQDQQDLHAARESGQPEAVVRNWMFANSIHTIDYLRVFGRGEVTDVTCAAPWDAARPGTVLAKIGYSSGDIGLYEGVWNGPGPWAITVSTPEVRVEMRPLESLSVQRRGERKLVPVELDAIDTQFKPGLRRQAEQALHAARGETTTLPQLEDAFASTRLCARIFGLA